MDCLSQLNPFSFISQLISGNRAATSKLMEAHSFSDEKKDLVFNFYQFCTSLSLPAVQLKPVFQFLFTRKLSKILNKHQGLLESVIFFTPSPLR